MVTYEMVEFENSPVEVHDDCKKITDHFRGIYGMYPTQFDEGKPEEVNHVTNRLELQTLGSRPNMPKYQSSRSLIPSKVPLSGPT